MKGRRTKPTALKILEGNPGGRPLPENEPTPPEGPVVRPLTMSVPATETWNHYAPMIAKMGLLTAVDVPAFAMLCELIAESEFSPRAMPAARIARMESLFSRFGMDPSSRARLGKVAPANGAGGSPWAELTG